MSVTRLSNRYAKSLIELAQEQDVLAQVTSEVEGIKSVIEESKDFAVLLKSPIIKEDVKRKVMEQAFAEEVTELTMAFLRIIIHKGREKYLLNILKAYKDQYNKLKGIVPVELTTAFALDDDDREDFTELLRKEFGKKKVELNSRVDKDIVGGFILEYDHNRFDASVRHQLDEIKKEFHKQSSIKLS
jgi:F-type H+-transporting ATPase subunit delta